MTAEARGGCGYLWRDEVAAVVRAEVSSAPVLDLHTHLFEPRFGGILLRGIDELLTYHYLIAEVVGATDMDPAAFYKMSKRAQAELVWNELFVKRSPVSEAARGVITAVTAYGLDARRDGLDGMRKFFRGLSMEEHVDLAFRAAGLESVVMTNDPLNDAERQVWEKGGSRDGRFLAALRIDPLVGNLAGTSSALRGWGYDVAADLSGKSVSNLRRFLSDWIKRMDAKYCAISLTPDFAWPDSTAGGRVLGEAVIPTCREAGIPLALMIGVRRKVRADLRDAGDAVGRADVCAVGRLCAEFPDVPFLITMLSRENQHELAVLARKFSNLRLFGCWWFLNNPSIVSEITSERLELLGLSFVPQHSDARVLDQVVYKWRHSKKTIADVLVTKYLELHDSGWRLAAADISRDVDMLFRRTAQSWLAVNGD
jgi:hypothetical protein